MSGTAVWTRRRVCSCGTPFAIPTTPTTCSILRLPSKLQGKVGRAVPTPGSHRSALWSPRRVTPCLLVRCSSRTAEKVDAGAGAGLGVGVFLEKDAHQSKERFVFSLLGVDVAALRQLGCLEACWHLFLRKAWSCVQGLGRSQMGAPLKAPCIVASWAGPVSSNCSLRFGEQK